MPAAVRNASGDGGPSRSVPAACRRPPNERSAGSRADGEDPPAPAERRAETAAVFERIPAFADDPLWGEIYRAGPAVFYYFAVWLAPFAPPLPEEGGRRLP